MPRQDDVDDFMASILGGSPAPAPKPKHSVFPKKQPRVQATQHHTSPQPQIRHATNRTQRRSGKRLLSLVLILLGLALLTGGGYLLWRGPLADLLAPKSPFSAKIQENMGVPLYFPTKLPGSFKIETGSITQPAGDVVLYAVTDDSGKRINITLQKKPSGINLDPLYAALSDLKDIETKQFGKVKTGVSKEGAQITNVLAEKTWILINYTKDTMNETQLTELLNSFKQ